MKTLKVKAHIDNVEQIVEFVNEQLDEMECSKRTRIQIDVALDELLSNVCHYAYDDGDGYVSVRVEEIPDIDSVRITLLDEGIPFDPLQQEDPDTTLGLHERGVGGLGIYMVKKSMDDIQYEYRDGMNILTVVKTL